MMLPFGTGALSLSRCFGIGLGVVTALGLPGAPSPPPPPAAAAWSAHARSVLHEIMQSERSFVRIHAAEALMAAGEADAVREYFTRELPNTETSAFRVGVWRVLANTARSADERNRWIAKVERTYCDEAAPDRGTAIETLCKLRHRVSGRALELVRREAAGAPSGPTVLALWSAQLAGDPHALGGLIAMLGSNDALVRRGAAYALRWLEPSDSVTRQALVRAVTREPPGSQAYAYILGAALTVGADPGQARTWEAELDRVLAAGPTDARFEASWTLKHRYRAADLPRVAALLDLPAKENDARIGAAAIILATLARP